MCVVRRDFRIKCLHRTFATDRVLTCTLAACDAHGIVDNQSRGGKLSMSYASFAQEPTTSCMSCLEKHEEEARATVAQSMDNTAAGQGNCTADC